MITIDNIQQIILKSIEIIVENAIKKAGFDKTVIGIVIEVMGDNKYKVAYNCQELILSCAVDVKITAGNAVYITFPQDETQHGYISGIRRK